MNRKGFERFLKNSSEIESKDKAVVSRLSKASWIEKNLDVDIDNIVDNPQKVFDLREKIYKKAGSKGYAGNIYNALRWYFFYKNRYRL